MKTVYMDCNVLLGQTQGDAGLVSRGICYACAAVRWDELYALRPQQVAKMAVNP